jgi:hypothetical protein
MLNREDASDDAALAQDDLIFIPKTGVARANLWVEQYIRNMLPFGSPVRPFPAPFEQWRWLDGFNRKHRG